MRTIVSLASQTAYNCQGWRPDAANSLARFLIKILAVVAIGFAANSARADGWTGNFTITSVNIAQQNNYQYRVNGVPAGNNAAATCTNATTWGYVNDADGGSQGMVAAIFSAYVSAKLVSLHVVTVNGYCHIIEMLISG